MSTTNPKKQSPLVQSVLALDEHFSELSRLSGMIHEMEPKSDSEFDHMKRLMNRFAECGQAVSDEVINLSAALNEARTKAEGDASVVSARAEMLQAREEDRQKKMEMFRVLGEKVHAITTSLGVMKGPASESDGPENRLQLSNRLAQVEEQIRPLIEEAQNLKTDARNSRMKNLEQSADSLEQSLVAVSRKLAAFQQANQPLQ